MRAVDGIGYSVEAGETVAIVGESGSGKSVSAMSILRLIPDPPGRIVGGEILFNGRDLLKLPEDAMRLVRGGEIGMIQAYYDLGVRSMLMTYNGQNLAGFGCHAPDDTGLTSFGRAVVEERYSLHRLAQQYAAVFQSLGGNSTREHSLSKPTAPTAPTA